MRKVFWDNNGHLRELDTNEPIQCWRHAAEVMQLGDGTIMPDRPCYRNCAAKAHCVGGGRPGETKEIYVVCMLFSHQVDIGLLVGPQNKE